ncbi:retrovirus-related pol polyprotein from transposon TNT 1-94 [Tanacetum coccineum]
MLIYAKASLFLWAKAVATICYTQNRSIIRLRHGKTPYELLHNKLPDLSFLHVFGALCYPTNDSENLGKLQPKVDTGIFIGYAPTKKAFRIYNRRTRRIIETIHVDFDELTAMASEHSSSGPALHEITPVTISSGLVPNPPPSTPFIPPSRGDWDLLFQPLFDELLTPPPSVDYPAPEVVAPIHEVEALVPAVSTGSPSSTNVNQDAPSPSNSQTTPETQPPVIPNDDRKHAKELNEFKRLRVWELVPRTDKVMVITLKWINKVKLDELGGCKIEAIRIFSLFCRSHELLRKLFMVEYKLHRASRYDMLSSFLISQDFSKGLVDPTLFIRRQGKELLLDSDAPSIISEQSETCPTNLLYACVPDSGSVGCQDIPVAHLVVCNSWEIDLLVGHQKGRKTMRYPVQKLNILLCLAVVLNSFG